MEERALVVLVVLGVAAACVTLWQQVDQGLEWCAAHLAAVSAALLGAGLGIAVLAFILGATPIALAGVALAVSAAVVHLVCSLAPEGVAAPGRGSVTARGASTEPPRHSPTGAVLPWR